MAVAYVVDEVFESHRPPAAHPECPERLTAVRAALSELDLAARGERLPLRRATEEELGRIHDAGYIGELSRIVPDAAGWLDEDTYFSPGTWEAALCAAGGAIDLAGAVMDGRATRGLAAVRPPGHHAEASRAMGFCLFNNVAIAAASARAAGAGRVAIVDWDVHHGNGTQHAFESDANVLFASVHQFPFYPGTGACDEVGIDEGLGTTVNVGLPAGCGDAEYLAVFDEVFAPALRRFGPDIVFVSAGFDAAAADPLAAMLLSRHGYDELAGRVCGLADELCEGRLVAVLEGGYDLGGLAGGVEALLSAMLGTGAARPLVGSASIQPTARAAIARTLAVHPGDFTIVNAPAMTAPVAFGDRYWLTQLLAVGGMAEIYLARQPSLKGFEKDVVIKRLKPELVSDSRIVDMFIDEARVGGVLNHPNIVHVYDIGEQDGIPFIAMEYIRGEELNQLCRRGLAVGEFLPLAHAIELVRQAARGMGYFHAARDAEGEPLDIVHCDISPTNLLATEDGFMQIIDFGIARARDQRYGEERGVPGKLSYMSPEQALRQPLDTRSDIFSLGVVLYEITLGHRLFKGPAQEVYERLASGDIRPPTFVRNDYPGALESIVMRCLEREPSERYETGYDLADALSDYLREEGLNSGAIRIARYLDRLAIAAGGERREELVSEAERRADEDDALDFDRGIFEGFRAAPDQADPARAAEWDEFDEDEQAVAAVIGIDVSLVRTSGKHAAAPHLAATPDEGFSEREPAESEQSSRGLLAGPRSRLESESVPPTRRGFQRARAEARTQRDVKADKPAASEAGGASQGQADSTSIRSTSPPRAGMGVGMLVFVVVLASALAAGVTYFATS